MQDQPPDGARLPLPGPRALWWAAAAAAIAMPLALSVPGGRPSASEGLVALQLELRVHNVAWLLATRMGEVPASPARPLALPASVTAAAAGQDVTPTAAVDLGAASTAAQPGVAPPLPPASTRTSRDGAASADPDADRPRWIRPQGPPPRAALARAQAEFARAIPALAARAEAIAGHDAALGRRARSEVVAHAVAIGAYAEAAAVAGAIDPDALAARAVARSARGAAVPAGALTDAAALERARSPGFGASWSPFVRARVQARIGRFAGDAKLARRANAELQALQDGALPLLATLFQMLMLAGLAGVGLWLYAGARSASAPASGARLDWLRARLGGGIGGPAPWPTDPLLPILGLGTWLAATMTAAALLALLPAGRQALGLGVLFQTLTGLLVAWALATAFGRGISAPQTLGLWRPLGDGDAARGSVIGLVAYAALLPPMILAALASALVWAWLVGDATQAHPVAELLLQAQGDPVQTAALLFAAVVAAPVAEELVFRGLVYRALRDSVGPGRALVASALAFAVMHMALPMLLPYLLLGLAFAWLYELTGSLWPSITLHALWNGVVLAALMLVLQA